jgi:hypothetical protein
LAADDEDYEWPACFCIVGAPSVDEAKAWGDRLASRYANVSAQPLLWSIVEIFVKSTLTNKEKLPCVRYGHEADEGKIGWSSK